MLDMPLNKRINEQYYEQLNEIIGGEDSCYTFANVEQTYVLHWLLEQLKRPSPEWKPYIDIFP